MATQTAQKVRQEILSALGLGGAPQEDPWAKLLFEESKKTALPGLEQALIGRGLGGSTVYKEAITDLLSKLGTQGALGSEQLKLGRLSALQNMLLPQQQYGLNLQQMGAQTGLNEAQQAQQLYQAMLPYTATYSGGKDYSGLWNLLGTGLGVGASMLIPGAQAALPLILGATGAGGATQAFSNSSRPRLTYADYMSGQGGF